MWQKIRIHNPYRPSEASRFTRSASTPRKQRQWAHVYESARSSGLPEGRAIAAASSAVKRTNPKRQHSVHAIRRPALASFPSEHYTLSSHRTKRGAEKARRKAVRSRRYASTSVNPLLADIVAYDVIGKGYQKAKKYLSKKNPVAFKSFEAAQKYAAGRIGHQYIEKIGSHWVVGNRKLKNPYLAVLGNPRKKKAKTNKGGSSMAAARKRKRNRRMPKRNAKGRFMKASAARTRNRHRRRRHNPVKVRVKYRTKVKNVVRYRTRKRATNKRRGRRRNPQVVVVAAPAARRRRRSNPKRRTYNMAARRSRKRNVHHRRHHHVRHHRRRNLSASKFIPTTNQIKDILWVAGGVFIGGKAVGIVYDKVKATLNLSGTADTVGRLVVGGALTALVWGMNPKLGLGVGLGAFSTLTDQLFGYAWGLQSSYTGIAGLKDYMNRDYKVESPGWHSLPTANAMAGLGANPLTKRTM